MKKIFHVAWLATFINLPVWAVENVTPKKVIPVELGKKVVARYSEIVLDTYQTALADAEALRGALKQLTTSPSQTSMDQAKAAWIKARQSYGLTEAFRFYGGPIDHETGPEPLINAWPIDEVYIDYVKGDENGGIINHPKEFPKINEKVLTELNTKNGEKNISTGYHAIEFLLWGQDHSSTGPGARPWEDYKSAKNADRRAQYLVVLGDLLVKNLATVTNAWKPGIKGNYVDGFKTESLEESLRKIYTGMINLSLDEMAGERMTVAFEKSDQENEQDCFSDTTTLSMVANQAGIRNVYFGIFKGTKGDSISSIVHAIDPVLAKKTDAMMERTTELVKKFPAPFDQVVSAKKESPKRKYGEKTIKTLEDQAHLIGQSGVMMGLVLNVESGL